MKVLIVSTTTHAEKSTSKMVLSHVADRLKGQHELWYVDANQLHIVENQSCYSDGKFNCANPEAGPYRCWAHKLSHENPSLYGGKDQMSIIYDALHWCDVVIWGTSVRWGSHSAIMQKIIERLTNFENRKVTYGEPNPLEGTICGVVVTGHNYESDSVANHLLTQFTWFNFKADQSNNFTWQKTQDVHKEQDGTNNHSLYTYLMSEEGRDHLSRFLQNLELNDEETL